MYDHQINTSRPDLGLGDHRFMEGLVPPAPRFTDTRAWLEDFAALRWQSFLDAAGDPEWAAELYAARAELLAREHLSEAEPIKRFDASWTTAVRSPRWRLGARGAHAS